MVDDQYRTQGDPTPVYPNPFPGKYRIVDRLGVGSFGQVWLANDLHLGRDVAMKTIVHKGAEMESVRTVALSNEARVLGSIDHPNIVRVYSWEESEDEGFLVMQYVPGSSLAERLEKERRLPWAVACRYVADLAEGLSSIHQKGVIHRDIKPANMLWDSSRDEVLLTDFGLAALKGQAHGGGTIMYMAPESYWGEIDERADCYSMSVSLFELIAGVVPFTGENEKEVQEAKRRGLPADDTRLGEIPSEMEQVIRRGLEPQPEQRPSLYEFYQSLRRVLNSLLGESFLTLDGNSHLRMEVMLDEHGELRRLNDLFSSENTTRDIKRVRRKVKRVALKTGDVFRIVFHLNRTGYLTVLNIGPSGNLGVLFPSPDGELRAESFLRSPGTLEIGDLALAPPAGKDKLIGILTWDPPGQDWIDALLAHRGNQPVSSEYTSSRVTSRLLAELRCRSPREYEVDVIEIDHRN